MPTFSRQVDIKSTEQILCYLENRAFYLIVKVGYVNTPRGPMFFQDHLGRACQQRVQASVLQELVQVQEKAFTMDGWIYGLYKVFTFETN